MLTRELAEASPLTSGLVVAYVDGVERLSKRSGLYGANPQFIYPTGVATRGGTAVAEQTSNTAWIQLAERGIRRARADWTVQVTGAWNGGSYGTVFCIPYTSSWSNPYATLLLRRNGSANSMQVLAANAAGSSFDSAASSSGLLPVVSSPTSADISTITVRKRGATLSFFRDGTAYGTATLGSGSALNFNGGNALPPILWSRHPVQTGDWSAGIVGPVFMWDRALTDGQIRMAERRWGTLLTPTVTHRRAITPSGAVLTAGASAGGSATVTPTCRLTATAAVVGAGVATADARPRLATTTTATTTGTATSAIVVTRSSAVAAAASATATVTAVPTLVTASPNVATSGISSATVAAHLLHAAGASVSSTSTATVVPLLVTSAPTVTTSGAATVTAVVTTSATATVLAAAASSSDSRPALILAARVVTVGTATASTIVDGGGGEPANEYVDATSGAEPDVTVSGRRPGVTSGYRPRTTHSASRPGDTSGVEADHDLAARRASRRLATIYRLFARADCTSGAAANRSWITRGARALTGGTATTYASTELRAIAAAAATDGNATITAAPSVDRRPTAAAAGLAAVAASAEPLASFVTIGDSYTWMLQGGGSTFARVDAAYPFEFFGTVSSKTIASMANAPLAVADPASVSDQGYPVYGSGNGTAGYTAKGLLLDELASRGANVSTLALHGYGKGGTSVATTPTSTYGKPWSYGIPGGLTTGLTAANAVAADSQWARVDPARPWDATTCAQRIATTRNLTVFVSLGGNDVIQHGGEYNWVDRNTGTLDSRWATRADVTKTGLDQIADFLRRLNPSAHVVHLSYPNMALDDTRRVTPQIHRPAIDTVEYPDRSQYDAGYRNYPGADYSSPYADPWALEYVDFDPAWFAPGNPGAGIIHTHPGFARVLFMGTNLTRDWDVEAKDWTLRWYAHAYADRRYDNGWFFFFGWQHLSWSDEFGAAMSNQLINAYPWSIPQFFTAMTKDLTTKRWSETVWRDLLGPRFAAVATAANAAGSVWTYLPLWDAIDGGGGATPDVKAPAVERFFDTLHLDRQGAEDWVDKVVDAWLPTSPFRPLIGV